MKTFVTRALWLAALLLMPALAIAQETPPKVVFQTSMGNFTLELDRQNAPATVENFLRYIREGHYDMTVFYRVVPGFIIQAGSFGADGKPRGVHDPIPLETAATGPNARGTITMARGDEPASARAEFFINLADNASLNRLPDDMENRTGFASFGHVVEGMEIVDAIAMVPLMGGVGPFPDAAPATPVVIEKIVIQN